MSQTTETSIDTKVTGTVYDPSKAYSWAPDDIFSLTGGEFGFSLQWLRERKAKVIRELEVLNIFEQKLKEAVESGRAKECTQG